jgi:hypothetical protein
MGGFDDRIIDDVRERISTWLVASCCSYLASTTASSRLRVQADWQKLKAGSISSGA